MLPVARPKRGAIQQRSRSDQRVAQFDTVTLAILAEIIACPSPCFAVNRRTNEQSKQVGERRMLVRPRAGPKLRGAYRRVQDRAVGQAQFNPPRDNALLFSARNLDEDIGIHQNGHCFPGLPIRLPRRKLRTYSSASGKYARSFRVPTKACMAFLRWSSLPT